jgi:transcriptional regulator PpsR
MNISFAPPGSSPFRDLEKSLGAARSALSNSLLTIAGDVTLIIDQQDMIRDAALGTSALGEAWVDEWLGRAWIDIVSSESRNKISEMLKQARAGDLAKWRQVNLSSSLGEIPMRFLAVDADDQGRVVAIGRDLRAEAALQQRLLQAQQSIERDYVRMRQVEARYRMLFDLSTEAVLIADTATRRIAEANPAAIQLLSENGKPLVGASIASLFDADSRDAAIALLGSVAAADQSSRIAVRLDKGGGQVVMAASLFRQDRGSCFLIRLTRTDSVEVRQTASPLVEVLDNIPDALVVTDADLVILSENNAFLDMAQASRKEQVRGQTLGRFLGRPGIDLNLLVSQLREHGSARNFATILRGVFDDQEEVEVSAVSVRDGDGVRYGFSIRSVGRRISNAPPATPGLPHSVEQLTELVGRVSLKDIVRESTDLIERLCIEAALVYTSDNRASAAEVLGLSRQSLYSKLHRHGLGNLGDDGV